MKQELKQKPVLLTIRGGGVKAPGIGVMQALKKSSIKVAGYSGTSIGSIIAALGAVGTSPDEILNLLKKYAMDYCAASRLKGGKGSQIIEDTVNDQCKNIKFKDLLKPLFITANQGSIWRPELFLFSNKTTPDVTLGQACRASCSFPIAYERYPIKIDQKYMHFWDGGMVCNPFIPKTSMVTVLATFRKRKTNTRSRYKNAWMLPEEQADFIISPYLADMGTFGTSDDIQMSTDLGYQETIRNLPRLLDLLK